MKLQSIQYLRGFAALCVLVYHASGAPFGWGAASRLFDLGAAGVDIFFAISGFIMVYTTDETTSPGRFMARRLVRIAPLYVVLTTAAFALAVIFPPWAQIFSSSWADYIRSILFIPFFNTNAQQAVPILGQGWTLNYEMLFYIIFALSLFLKGRARLITAASALIALAITGIILHPTDRVFSVYTSQFLIEFVFGMTIGCALLYRPAAFTRLAIAIAVVAVATILISFAFRQTLDYRGPYRFFSIGLPAAAMLSTLVAVELRGWLPTVPLALLLGDASYSIYLTHGFVVGALREAWMRSFGNGALGSRAGFLATAVLLAVAIGIFVFRLLERPMQNALAGYVRRRRGSQPDVIAMNP